MRLALLLSLSFSPAVALALPIQVIGTAGQAPRVQSWLNLIGRTPIGRQYLQAVTAGPRRLQIVHSFYARSSAGKTLLPMTTATSDGRGVNDIQIEMDLTIPFEGSCRVLGADGGKVAFPAPVNLFHELSHAYHGMKGDTKAMFEVQAIIDENVFRAQYAALTKRPMPARDIYGHDSSSDD